jgi:hypothetical protein
MTVPPAIILDANVLFSFTQRDLFIQARFLELALVHWTATICDEWTRNLAKHYGSDGQKERQVVADVERVFEDVRVGERPDLESLFPSVDAKDRHVVAAALGVHQLYEGNVPVWVVTWNLSDFDAAAMAIHHLRLLTPDEALLELLQIAPEPMCMAVREQVRRMTRSKPSFAMHCEMLASKDRLVHFVAALEPYRHLFGPGWPP